MVKAEVAKHFTSQAIKDIKNGKTEEAIFALEMFLSSISTKKQYTKKRKNANDEDSNITAKKTKNINDTDVHDSVHEEKEKKKDNDNDPELAALLDDISFDE